MKLEKLYLELATNPNKIVEIEEEITKLINEPDLSGVSLLYTSTLPEMKFYALKVVEERIKNKKISGIVPSQEIEFMRNIIQVDSQDKVAEVYSRLGIYEWPGNFPDFFQNIIDNISLKNEIGYKILYSFLHQMNYSQEINEKRKSELKKAIGLIYKGYMQLFEDDMAAYIIPIMTESLKVLPKDFDYSIVFRKGSDFPDKAVEFVNEMGDCLDIQKVIDLASKIPVSVGMLLFFNSIKNKSPNVPNVNLMYEYVFKGLRHDIATFTISLEFWKKFFSGKNRGSFVEQIITEVLSIYINLNEEQKNEVEGEVNGLINIMTKNYPDEIFSFLEKNINVLPKKISLYFIRKLDEQFVFLTKNNIPTNIDFNKIHPADPVIAGTVLSITNDTKVIEMLNYIDFTDKDAAKLVIKVLNNFQLTHEQINKIMEKSLSQQKESTNEIIVECFLKMGKVETFEEPWDNDKIMRFFYYLKKVPMSVSYLSNSYFKEFLRNSPFDRCFSILRMIGDFPKEIYENIYNNIFTYPYLDLACFNRDLLVFMKIQEPYIKREVERIVFDWSQLEDPEELVLCAKSLLSVMSDGITNSNNMNVPYHSINTLLDLLQIDDAGIVRRISDIFCNYKNTYDVKKAMYYFMLNYNSSYVEISHYNVAAALTLCIKAEGGAEVLYEMLGSTPISTCVNLREECMRSQTKRAQILVRNFLRDFKGKPLNSLYEDSFKVKEQNFIKNISKKGKGLDFEIDRTFFQ